VQGHEEAVEAKRKKRKRYAESAIHVASRSCREDNERSKKGRGAHEQTMSPVVESILGRHLVFWHLSDRLCVGRRRRIEPVCGEEGERASAVGGERRDCSSLSEDETHWQRARVRRPSL